MTFDHIAQVVPDIARAVAWHCEVLPGARVLYQDDSWALVEAGGVKVAFVLPGQHPAHVAFRVADEELDRLAVERGATVKPHRDGTRSFYVDGPSGQSIEIISYPAAR